MRKIAKYIILLFGITIIALLFLGGGFSSVKQTVTNNGEAVVFAHRGVTTHNVENSSKAFKNSLKYGFNAIETDVSCTKDGKLIIFHDESCKRLLNIDRDISAVNWNEINDKFLWYNGKETMNKVLSLDQYLEKINDSVLTYLDIKEFSKPIADSLLAILEKHENKSTIIADSDLFCLSYLKIKKPTVRVVLEGFNKGKEWLYYIIPKRFKPDFYSSFINQVDENHMKFLKKNNLLNKTIVYGVKPENISKAYDFGLTNIIYDYDSDSGNLEQIKECLTKNRYQ